MPEDNSFNYTYSAKEHEEIMNIQKKYGINRVEPSECEAALEELRRIDRSTTRPGMIVGVIVGIAGALIMGTGMSMSMVGSDRLFVPGIIVGVAGIAAVAASRPVYRAITKKKRERNAAIIKELSERLMDKTE